MIKTIIFYALLSLTISIFASEEGNRPWFTQIETTHIVQNPVILTCVCKQIPSDDFQKNIHFKQDEKGNLYALYKKEKERLLFFPDTFLNTQNTTVDLLGRSRVKITIPWIMNTNEPSDH